MYMSIMTGGPLPGGAVIGMTDLIHHYALTVAPYYSNCSHFIEASLQLFLEHLY